MRSGEAEDLNVQSDDYKFFSQDPTPLRGSKKLLALFPPGTEPTGRAKPEIWTDWAKFEAAAKDFQDAAPKLVPAAKSGVANQIPAARGAVGKTCGACHKPFRKPES